MKQDLLDQAAAAIARRAPGESDIENAAARVRSRLLDAPSSLNLHQLHGCSDLQELIPAYLAGSLPEAARLLLEDHTTSCVACRHALEFAKTGRKPTLRRPVVRDRTVVLPWRWPIAAMVACTLVIGLWSMYRFFAPGEGGGAVVKTVTGTLFAISGGGRQIFPGTAVDEREHVRTRADSDAVLKLADGSEIEMAPRSEIWMERVSAETTIHLARGQVIVHAAKQRRGALHVATAECRVSVKGTIFSVSEGLKGSRVSVVQGAVEVQQGKQARMLLPGQQATTDTSLEKTSVSKEVSWSRNAAQYLAVLGEFSSMAKELSQTAEPGLRYSSKLAPLAPENTLVYGAMPNIGPLLSQAEQIFTERLNQSEVLSEWWNQHKQTNGPALDSIIDRVRGFSDFLGNEVALAIVAEPDDKRVTPLFMAEVTRAGLPQYLTQQAAALNVQQHAFQFLAQLPASEGATPDRGLYAYISGNYLFLSPSIAILASADQAVKSQAAAGNYRMYSRISSAYAAGVGWLFAADMEQIRSSSVGEHETEAAKQRMVDTGMQDLDTIILERKGLDGGAQTFASFNFSEGRQGLAGWLSAPGPLGSLDFVSPDASMAVSAVMKTNGNLVWNLVHSAEQKDPQLSERLQSFANGHGRTYLNTLANALGGDFTFAIDGALIPIPSWKAAVEVYNAANCQWAIEQLIDGVNQQADAKVKLQLNKTAAGSNTLYRITADGSPFEVNYTYANNYLVAAASRVLLTQALQNQSTGYTLARSEQFRQQLPADGNLNFSGLLYYNAGPALNLVAQGLNATTAVTPAQKQAIATFAASSKPGLVYAYAQDQDILVSSKTGFFGLNIDTLSLPSLLSASLKHETPRMGARPN